MGRMHIKNWFGNSGTFVNRILPFIVRALRWHTHIDLSFAAGDTPAFISSPDWMQTVLCRARRALLVVGHAVAMAYDEQWGKWLEHHRSGLWEWAPALGVPR